MVIALDSLNALLTTITAVTMDWADTPDVRDRFTRESAQQHAKDALYAILRDCRQWLSEGLPSDAVVQQRISAVIEEMKEAKELVERRNAEFDEQDAEAAADQYGAILGYHDQTWMRTSFSRRCVGPNDVTVERAFVRFGEGVVQTLSIAEGFVQQWVEAVQEAKLELVRTFE